jgi:hypothetical protein
MLSFVPPAANSTAFRHFGILRHIHVRGNAPNGLLAFAWCPDGDAQIDRLPHEHPASSASTAQRW